MTIQEILKMNNNEFSANVKTFKASCEKAGIKPTKRQASKWRRKTGLAYNNKVKLH